MARRDSLLLAQLNYRIETINTSAHMCNVFVLNIAVCSSVLLLLLRLCARHTERIHSIAVYSFIDALLFRFVLFCFTAEMLSIPLNAMFLCLMQSAVLYVCV